MESATRNDYASCHLEFTESSDLSGLAEWDISPGMCSVRRASPDLVVGRQKSSFKVVTAFLTAVQGSVNAPMNAVNCLLVMQTVKV